MTEQTEQEQTAEQERQAAEERAEAERQAEQEAMQAPEEAPSTSGEYPASPTPDELREPVEDTQAQYDVDNPPPMWPTEQAPDYPPPAPARPTAEQIHAQRQREEPATDETKQQ